MTNATITNLRQAVGVTGTELLEAVQVGSSVRVTALQISQLSVLNGGITQAGIGATLYPITVAEIAAGVTPVNFVYPSGHPWRYGAKDDGITDNHIALQQWLLVGQQGIPLIFPSILGNEYSITSNISITAPVSIFGSGPRAFLLTRNCDGIQIAANTPQVFIRDIRIGNTVRYQANNGTVTVNAFAGIRMLGGSNANHYYLNVLCDGYQTGFVATGAEFSVFDNCSTIFGLNGIIASGLVANNVVRGGIYQCGNLGNAGVLTTSIGIQFGDGTAAAQGNVVCEGFIVTGFATQIWRLGENFGKTLDGFVDFTNGVGILCQSAGNAATCQEIRGNYIATTALATNGIRLLSNTASSNPLGTQIRGNQILSYAAGAVNGILVDGTSEQNNIIANNQINCGSLSDCQISQGTGHIVAGNRFEGLGFYGLVQLTYAADNVGPLIANAFTFVNLPLFSVVQNPTLAYSASITPDLHTGNSQVITVTTGAAFTINAPINPPASGGVRLRIRLANASGGAFGAVTWAASYKVPAGITYPASGFNRTYDFELGVAGGTYYLTSSPTVDIPN